MKKFSFLFYLLSHGTLKSKPVDFQKIESSHLGLNKKKSFYTRIRTALALNTVTGSVVANLAYLKNLSRQHRNFFFADELKIGYIRILKSASTSMLRELIPLIDSDQKNKKLSDKQVDLFAAHYVSHKISGARQQYELFTIVRNPLQRLVSVYLDLFNPDNPHFGYENYLFGILKREMTFHQFVQVVSKIPDSLKSGHFTQQVNVIKYCGGLNKVKYLRLEKDAEALQSFLASKKLALSHSNKNVNYDYRTFYNAESLQLAYNIYKEDIKIFGYQNEYQALCDYVRG